MSEQALLEVENLRIDIVSGSSKHNVVEDVSFTIGAGETFGLVGEFWLRKEHHCTIDDRIAAQTTVDNRWRDTLQRAGFAVDVVA